MKKTGLAALVAVSTILGGSAQASEARTNAMKHIAQVLAAQRLCDRIEAQQGMLLMLAGTYNIDFDRDRDQLLAMTREQMRGFAGQPQELACLAGIALYGPDGQNVSGLLREK